jgi:uncharacterized RDD family membrane protein YckC
MRWRKIKNSNNKIELNNHHKPQYAGFMSRLFAFVTDIFMIGLPISLVIMMIFGHDDMQSVSAIDVLLDKEPESGVNPMISIVQMTLSMMAYIFLWNHDGQSPGKKFAQIKIVNAKTFQKPKLWQLVLRFFGYFLSFITLLGFYVGLVRKDKRALHDLISGTAVINYSEILNDTKDDKSNNDKK